MNIKTDPKFEAKLAAYPEQVRDKMYALRKLVLETAEEIPQITAIEETLKWGEPSFLTKQGSNLRMDWKQKAPDQYAMYFKCTSRLVETFKVVFGNQFEYEKSRAILFKIDQKVPSKALKKCIKATLTYHKVKDDVMLELVQEA